ncbi:L-seryl-tRNA(Sec) selenium transferase [Paracoccus suum]|uniref:L-seryl-tRNA(Sec) selenium transferase n=1 Tax=Paracoccus suum TaxID=2259340 RepID=A0A344PHR3_9RHOB|nr:L-seryl-tRNA(Sec) selenium transferase [Paracoccus suum]AXC48918.1 L-seryl-tRNA(Sec) selenium transferase [Paracoccus suum]
MEPGLRALPSVDQLLMAPDGQSLARHYGKALATGALRAALAELRSAIREGAPASAAPAAQVIATAEANLAAAALSPLRTVLNLTGTVLHTNLGRALLAEPAIAAATEAMRDPIALEYDLATGARGERDAHLRALLCELTGAEDATVVNNNAAAVLLALNTLGAGREAIVSRGELIEIGGAFRMPDIMARAGVQLREVGTTNRTHERDYRGALGPQTGLILKVHTSNYRIQGFTAEVSAPRLAALADEAGVPLLNDLGSGSLVDLGRWGLRREPTVAEAVAEGAHVVTFSGDKLLGGPQAGFIVGRREAITAINRNPMKRALRLDKIRIAALYATLRLYLDPDRLTERLPVLAMLSRSQAEIAAQAEALLGRANDALGASGITASVISCDSQVGSGALPTDLIASAALALAPPSTDGAAPDRLAARLRSGGQPVIGRVRDGAVILDLRCLRPGDEPALLSAIAEAVR